MVLLGAFLTLGLVGSVSVVALSIVLLDGLIAWPVLLAAGLAGGWVFSLLGIRDVRWSERLILGGAFGIGMLGLVVLGLGSVGLLTRAVLVGLLVVLGLAGLSRFLLDARRQQRASTSAGRGDSGDASNFLWLVVVPFFVLIQLACALPPGVLWQEEGFGYDVLEYHLAVPRAFHEEGAITFLPENVYSNFPLNYEMLALVMMTLHGDAIEAAFMAKMVNALLAGLFVASAWLAGCRWSPRAGIAAGVLAGTAPWLTYLAGIAFVETGMLAMGLASWACLLRTNAGPRDHWRWALLAGLLAGLACGFKYTALPFIALPAALLLWVSRTRGMLLLRDMLLLGLGTLITFSPWLIRNAANTGNPVFPLAYGVFGANDEAWSADLAERWQRGHAPPSFWPEESGVIRALHGASRAWELSLGDDRVGLPLLLFALIGVVARRDRLTLMLMLALLLQIGTWYLFTHQYARFASVMLLPLILLGARGFCPPRSALVTLLLSGVLVAGAGWNFLRIGSLYYHEASPRHGEELYGRTQLFLNGFEPMATLNTLEADAKILLVGEARTFYLRPAVAYAVVFNRHPLEDVLSDLPDRPLPGEPPAPDQAERILRELQDRGITHIFVNWNEVRRLRATYGFPREIDEAFFSGLEAAGLTTVKQFLPGRSDDPWAVLYELKTLD